MSRLISFRLLLAATLLAMSLPAWAPSAEADDPQWDFKPKPVARVPGGVVLGDAISGWSDPILTAKIRLTEGDVDAVSSTVNHYAEKFNLVLLANVRRAAADDYYLDKVGVGFSTDIAGRQVVITSDTHERLGANLGFIGGQVFSGNEAALEEVTQVARYRHGLVMDAPALMAIDNRHVLRRVRHFIWVSKATGKLGTLVWEMGGRAVNNYGTHGEAMNLLPPNLQETRNMHVDGGEFTFGIPGKKAFALVRLPPGRTVPFTPELRRVAAVRAFDESSYLKLLTLVAQEVAAVR